MTASAASGSAAPTQVRVRSQVPPATDRFDHVLRSEWTKFWSVRSTLYTFVALVIVTIGISALLCLAVAVNWTDIKPADRAQIDPVSQSLSGIFLGQMAIIALGALAISSEYSTGGIRTTLTAVPQRLRVLGAKALVLTVTAFGAGLVTMFASFWLGQRVLATADAHPPIDVSIGDPNVLRAVIGGALYVAACGLLGFALGALLRHTAGAITVAIGIVFVLPIVANFLPGTWGDNVGKVLNAGGAISNTRHVSGQFDPWTGYAVFSLWWVVLLTLAAILMLRRDA
ncbi:MAG: type transport system permease protein [Actinomycetota bacterium]|jgi:ABC-type transport system involved in multi-copper enzyme maturation permease subunit|nr:type transport system permease protein [Actinomycetota bacterium]